ncbi:MAG: hypothetical protein JNL38_16860 [Myxococcales bacterium]|jgi:hypothetical protein|nr:hypothetical protein [Myxococcales bacterium]
MIKRLVIGLFLGTLLGAIVGVALVQGLGMSFAGGGGAVLAYLTAAVTGVLTGLVTGKPIWSADGKIEAGLKAFFGALLALGGMFAIRQWLTVDLDLSSLKAGHGPIGELPVAALPIISGVLGTFFELDNSPKKGGEDSDKDDKASASKSKVRVADDEGEAEELEEEEEPAAKKKGKR